MKYKQKPIDEARQRRKKDLLLDILVVAGLVSIALCVIQYINYKVDPVHAFLLGCKPIQIENDSMEPVLPQNSLVVVRKANYSSLAVDDIIAYSINGRDIILRKISSINAAGIRTVALKDGIHDGDLVLPEHVVGKIAFVWKGYAVFSGRGILFLLIGLMLLSALAALYFLRKKWFAGMPIQAKLEEKKAGESVTADESFPDIEALLLQETHSLQGAPRAETVIYDFDNLLTAQPELQKMEVDFEQMLWEKMGEKEADAVQMPLMPEKEPDASAENVSDMQEFFQGIIDLL